MDSEISIFVAIILGAAFAVLLMLVYNARRSTGGDKNKKNRTNLMHNCMRQLSRDPHNIEALTTLAAIYFEDAQFEKSYPLYSTLFTLSDSHVEIDAGLTSERFGICAFKIGKQNEAVTALVKACKFLPTSFNANFYLGLLMYQMGEFQKAIMCLRRARTLSPEAPGINENLGLAYFKAKQYRESLPFLRRAVEEQPAGKELLFALATAMSETGYNENALKLFLHLRPDPVYGAEASLAAGRIHENMHQSDLALEDYEIGLKLENTPIETATLLRYRLALVYLASKNIPKALMLLRQIQATSPNFKDVNTLVQRYQELNSNANLQIYLLAGMNDFVALCRRVVSSYYSDASTKIEDVSVKADFIDILCTVETSRWEDTEMFRFYRTTNAVGELFIRDFHAKLHEIKADKGLCFTAGVFTEGAQRYAEGRPVDLIDKTRLSALLKKV